METFALVTVVAVLGLAVGSFSNVVIYRVPRHESVVRPASRCPGCGQTLRARENIPVVSWLIQRGRCRTCRTPISPRYLVVEVLTATLFAIAAATLPRATDLIAYLPIIWSLVVLSFIDLEHKLLPNRIVLPTLGAAVVLLGLAAALGPGLGAWISALIAGGGAFVFFLILAIIAPGGMGMGDVKLSPILGMALGYLGPWERVFIGFLGAFILGALVGLGLMAIRRAGRKSQIPFGPSLAAGTLIGVFWGTGLLHLWLG